MSIQEIKQLKTGDNVGFAGILSANTRQGKFVRLINEFLAEISYGNHTEQNHIANLYKV